jgi:hypothetical protein
MQIFLIAEVRSEDGVIALPTCFCALAELMLSSNHFFTRGTSSHGYQSLLKVEGNIHKLQWVGLHQTQ